MAGNMEAMSWTVNVRRPTCAKFSRNVFLEQRIDRRHERLDRMSLSMCEIAQRDKDRQHGVFPPVDAARGSGRIHRIGAYGLRCVFDAGFHVPNVGARWRRPGLGRGRRARWRRGSAAMISSSSGQPVSSNAWKACRYTETMEASYFSSEARLDGGFQRRFFRLGRDMVHSAVVVMLDAKAVEKIAQHGGMAADQPDLRAGSRRSRNSFCLRPRASLIHAKRSVRGLRSINMGRSLRCFARFSIRFL